MAEQITVGQTDAMRIEFLDQNGLPMATPPTPDSPPVWTVGNDAVETVTASADGMSAVQTAVSVGTDTLSLTVVVGGRDFSATLGVTVEAAPQVLTSVRIVSGTPA